MVQAEHGLRAPGNYTDSDAVSNVKNVGNAYGKSNKKGGYHKLLFLGILYVRDGLGHHLSIEWEVNFCVRLFYCYFLV